MILSRRHASRFQRRDAILVSPIDYEHDKFVVVSQKFGYFKVSTKTSLLSPLNSDESFQRHNQLQNKLWRLSTEEPMEIAALSDEFPVAPVTDKIVADDTEARRQERRTSLEKFKDSSSFSLSEDINYRSGSQILQDGMFFVDFENEMPHFLTPSPSISITEPSLNTEGIAQNDAMSPVPEGRESALSSASNYNCSSAIPATILPTPDIKLPTDVKGAANASISSKVNSKLPNIRLSFEEEAVLAKKPIVPYRGAFRVQRSGSGGYLYLMKSNSPTKQVGGGRAWETAKKTTDTHKKSVRKKV